MKGPQDEKLIKDLYEKLNWFTFQARDEEFDEKQVKAILQLLDTLDPIDFEGVEKECEQNEKSSLQSGRMQEKPQKQISAVDADAAFERFKKKYAVTDAGLEKKDRAKIIPFAGAEEASDELAPDMEKILAMEPAGLQAENGQAHGKKERVRGRRGNKGKRRRFWNTAGGRVAIAFLCIFTALAVTGICTSAVQQKPFFEIVRDGMNSMKITVTGNEMESQTELSMENSEKTYYESWDEIKAENPEVVVPGYIPEGLELVELSGKEFGNYVRYNGVYKDEKGSKLLIRVRYFIKGYVENNIENELEYIEDENGVFYYLEPKGYRGYKESGKCSCSVYFDNLDKLKDIINKIE